MPVNVDELHVCVRIREIEGECDEMFTTRKSKKPESSEDESINKVGDDDNYGGNGGAFGEQKGDNGNDEDFYDNRDKDLFNDEGDDEQPGVGSGWINDIARAGDATPLKRRYSERGGDSPMSSEFDNIRQQVLALANNSNIQVILESQPQKSASPKKSHCDKVSSSRFVHNCLNGDTSTSTLKVTDTFDIDAHSDSESRDNGYVKGPCAFKMSTCCLRGESSNVIENKQKTRALRRG
ncbi:hypothetical protein Tco_1402712 [Tanacetum coccineum]